MKQRNLTGGSVVVPNSLGLESTPDDGVRVLGTDDSASSTLLVLRPVKNRHRIRNSNNW